jgi:hypothetical protein
MKADEARKGIKALANEQLEAHGYSSSAQGPVPAPLQAERSFRHLLPAVEPTRQTSKR